MPLLSLRQPAIRNHHSVQEQVRLLIEREVRYAPVGAVQRARQWRYVLAGPQCVSVLLKQVQRHLLSADECRALLADVLQLPLRPSRSSELVPKHRATLITADKQLAKAAASLGCLADETFD